MQRVPLRARNTLASAQSGAVMVEFLIAYLPILVAFLMFWQLGELLVAQLVVERASSAAGRAAVVVVPDDPAFYQGLVPGAYDGQRKREIRLAAGMMLAASPHLSENFTVDVQNVPAPGEDTSQELTVEIDAEFRCNRLKWVCGADGVTVLKASSQHTYQGASYGYEPTDLSNTGNVDSETGSNEPGCSDTETPSAGGGSNHGGGGGAGSHEESGACPPGQVENKDGTCSSSRGSNKRCKDGSTPNPDGLCSDGLCASTGKRPADPHGADPCGQDSLACKCMNQVKGAWGKLKSACRRTPRNQSEVNQDNSELLETEQTCERGPSCDLSPYKPGCDDSGGAGGGGGIGGSGGMSGSGGAGGHGGNGGSGGRPDCNDPTKNGGRNALPNSCGQCRYVYRRDTRPPSEIFKTGFTSKGSSYDLSDYVVGADTKSGFISTTTDENVALKLSWQANDQLSWKSGGKPQPNNDYIYEIRDCGSGVDVNATLKPDDCSEAAVADKIRRYQYQKEIAIPGKIDADDIVAVIQPRESDRPPSPPQPEGGKPMTPAQQEAFKNWPSLSDIQNHATPLPNVGYSPKDDQKRIAECKKNAGQ